MKTLKRSWLGAVVLIGSLILTSCHLPFKIVPNVRGGGNRNYSTISHE